MQFPKSHLEAENPFDLFCQNIVTKIRMKKFSVNERDLAQNKPYLLSLVIHYSGLSRRRYKIRGRDWCPLRFRPIIFSWPTGQPAGRYHSRFFCVSWTWNHLLESIIFSQHIYTTKLISNLLKDCKNLTRRPTFMSEIFWNLWSLEYFIF